MAELAASASDWTGLGLASLVDSAPTSVAGSMSSGNTCGPSSVAASGISLTSSSSYAPSMASSTGHQQSFDDSEGFQECFQAASDLFLNEEQDAEVDAAAAELLSGHRQQQQQHQQATVSSLSSFLDAYTPIRSVQSFQPVKEEDEVCGNRHIHQPMSVPPHMGHGSNQQNFAPSVGSGAPRRRPLLKSLSYQADDAASLINQRMMDRQGRSSSDLAMNTFVTSGSIHSVQQVESPSPFALPSPVSFIYCNFGIIQTNFFIQLFNKAELNGIDGQFGNIDEQCIITNGQH